MASSPAFASTPNVTSVLVPATQDTSLTAPTHTALAWTPGASGGKIEEIRVQGVGTTVAGRLNVFRYDGTTYWLVDQYLVTAVTPSSSVAVFQLTTDYTNLELISTDKLYVTVMEVGNVSLLCVTCLGGNF